MECSVFPAMPEEYTCQRNEYGSTAERWLSQGEEPGKPLQKGWKAYSNFWRLINWGWREILRAERRTHTKDRGTNEHSMEWNYKQFSRAEALANVGKAYDIEGEKGWGKSWKVLNAFMSLKFLFKEVQASSWGLQLIGNIFGQERGMTRFIFSKDHYDSSGVAEIITFKARGSKNSYKLTAVALGIEEKRRLHRCLGGKMNMALTWRVICKDVQVDGDIYKTRTKERSFNEGEGKSL